jgi:putative membrane protein
MDRPSAARYVEQAAMADFFEIRASQVALDRLHHLDVRQFARTMIDHHHQSADLLKHAVRIGNTPAPVPPPALDRAQAQKIRELSAAPAGSVDHIYLDVQAKAHEEALRLHQYYAQYGDDPVLRRAAAERALLVEHHLAQIHGMAQNLASAAR